MLPPPDLSVDIDDVRPARPDGTCFYCRQKLDTPHLDDCVCRTRTVVLDITIRATTLVPANWTTEDIHYFYNEHNAGYNNYNNFINCLQRWPIRTALQAPETWGDEPKMLVTYVREASELDEDTDCMYAGDPLNDGWHF